MVWDFKREQGTAVHLDGTLFHLFAPACEEIFLCTDVEQVNAADDQVVAPLPVQFDGFCDDGFLSAAGFAVDGQAAASLFQGSNDRPDLFGATEDTASCGNLVKGERKVHQEDLTKLLQI